MDKNHYFWHLLPLNPQIKIFFKIQAVSLFYFTDLQLYAKFQKKIMNSLWDI